jgi:hypothetical protein
VKEYVFSVKEGSSSITQKAAETLGPLLVELGEKRVKSVPRALVDLARPKNHPAHRFFEWDDAKAGERFRIHQARQYQQRIVYEVVVTTRNREPVTTQMRVVYPVKDSKGVPSYISGAAVTRDVDAMEQLIERALTQLSVWKNTYSHLRGVAELTGIFDAIEKSLARRHLKVAK